ncbi:glycosyltransferase [Clostridium sp. C2-6-12]|uniref:glycosyltransferase n=1 Tax=Clostridium sp. C2-6-12 TaxID=2698832 RepID=UPI001370B55B|nr:glycosyltransferase [Clostridium sp. C2-6-12]
MENSIAFITCVNDEERYEECIKYIDSLYIPDGITKEKIAVRNAKSMTSGYNQAMNSSNAKIKVYLHQDTLIVNKNFILDILVIFERNDKVGMLGVVGAKSIPLSGIWWESNDKYGKVFENSNSIMNELKFKDVNSRFEEVDAIDGLIMVTQYDIPWNESKFKGWHFYDLSQCIEFEKRGYIIAIPQQVTPWVLHDCGIVSTNNYDMERKLFINEYQEQFYPKVSVIAVDCSDETIQSFINNQSYSKIEMISINENECYIPNVINYKWRNEEDKYAGLIDVINSCSGNYITFLENDDYCINNKIEYMLNYMIQHNSIDVLFCQRKKRDENNNVLSDNILKKYNKASNCVFDGKEFLKFCVNENENLFGNLSTMLFKKSALNKNSVVNNSYELLYKFKFIVNAIVFNNIGVIENEFIINKRKKFIPSLLKEEINEYINLCIELCQCNIIQDILKIYENIEKILPWTYLDDTYKWFCKEYEKALKNNNIEIKYNSKYKYNADYKVFVGRNYNYVDYSDGSENYIYEVFKREECISSYPVELGKYIKDWASEYHLTQVRTNLLHSIEELITEKGKALELGAGMGASTNWLADIFENVHCIEGSISRAKALRERNKKNENVKVFVDDLNNENFPENNYDMITLLGVLEYLPFYSKEEPENVCKKMLEKINNNLSEKGIFVLAIENKMGEKYFAGCAEDHNGRLFSGINGYPEKSPITFSKKELTNMLKESGFNNVKFYFPFPDYKLPQCVIKEDKDIENFDVGAINRGNSLQYSGQREYLMMEPLTLNSLNQAGLLFDMSNSFLVVCSKQENVDLETKYLIRKYSNNRIKNELHHYSDFIKKDNEYYVEKKVIGKGQSYYSDDNLDFKLQDSKIIKGKNVIIDVYKSILKRDNLHSFEILCRRLKEEIVNQYSTERNDEDGYRIVKAEAFDFAFNNIIEKDDKWIYIDKKFNFKGYISEDFVMFRAIKNIYIDMNPYIPIYSLEEFAISIMKKIYTNFSKERYTLLCEMEEKCLNSIYYNYKYHDIKTGIFNKSLDIKNDILNALLAERRDNNE